MVISGNKRCVVIIAAIIAGILVFNRCSSFDKKNKKGSPKFSDFSRSEACFRCHDEIYKKHLNTAHFKSSAPAGKGLIKGSFDPGQNEFYYNEFSKVVMEERGDSLYQVHYLLEKEKAKSKFDIVIGSGKKGQSYLSWKRQSLIQMPITYFTPTNSWSISPGFSTATVAFNRVVTSRCLECHSTFVQKTSSEEKHPEEFDQSKIIYGISCEKCHGPGKEHVKFHSENPSITQAKYIINPAKLLRQINLDLCALCHGGRLEKIRPSFSFIAGDSLGEFFNIHKTAVSGDNIDVHGNQLGSLSFSKCFTNSNMTCESCHNVHENETGKLETFSARCMNCHSVGHSKTCGLTKELGEIINQNCLDCHMPLQPSQSIVVFLQGEMMPTHAKLRNHYIKIYKDESDKIIKFLRSNSGAKSRN
ncbi:MAG TPA: multiheme c-type cytochrome [Chitinophagaceae bacterium]|jgi:hypothetical protein|nr:multiheme c-type cytochrome [Chitinophagaceae bacterium]